MQSRPSHNVSYQSFTTWIHLYHFRFVDYPPHRWWEWCKDRGFWSWVFICLCLWCFTKNTWYKLLIWQKKHSTLKSMFLNFCETRLDCSSFSLDFPKRGQVDEINQFVATHNQCTTLRWFYYEINGMYIFIVWKQP